MSIPVLDMIMRSGLVARIIILLLVFFSLVTWAIIFNRVYVLSRLGSANRQFRNRFSGMKRLLDVENLSHKELSSPMAQLGRSGAMEYRRILQDAKSHTGVKDWSFFLQNQFSMAADHLQSVYSSLITSFDKGVFLLAMISSIAPFLGLLGTVWGIMNSFFEIGQQGSASLPVVAPGIAEALITTIVGLAVAIPSLFFYNFINNRAEKIEDEMDEFREQLTVRLKREIFNLLYGQRPPVKTSPDSSNT
ncbi:Tol-pal system protein TolQ [Chitinispirillum alkaliphilum]|nr:Tol-pal system protein TolQ [Chitinispirillum alkaliphilum]